MEDRRLHKQVELLSPELLEAMGKVIASWSLLEWHTGLTILELLGAQGEDTVAAMKHLPAHPKDVDLFEELILRRINKCHHTELKKLCNRIRNVGRRRGYFAHGVFFYLGPNFPDAADAFQVLRRGRGKHSGTLFDVTAEEILSLAHEIAERDMELLAFIKTHRLSAFVASLDTQL